MNAIGKWEVRSGKWLFAAVLVLVWGPALCQQSYSRTGVSVQAKPGGEITWWKSGRISGLGGVHIEAVNKAARTNLVADANEVNVVYFTGTKTKGAVSGLDSIKSAEFSGSVKMVFTAPKPVKDDTGKQTGEVMTTTQATADNVTFDGATGIARLTGHVKIIQDDPSMWAEPAVMTGDKASINLKRAPGAEDYDFKIESTTCPSRIEVVPKAREESAK
jgi:hypothetical protein